MPDLGTLLNPCSSSSISEIPCPDFKPPDQCESTTSHVPDSVLILDTNDNCSDWEQRLRFPIHTPKKLTVLKRCRSNNNKTTTATIGEEDKSPDEVSIGISSQNCVLPFLGPGKSVECHIYQILVHPGIEISCFARGCDATYITCAEQRLEVSSLITCSAYLSLIMKKSRRIRVTESTRYESTGQRGNSSNRLNL